MTFPRDWRQALADTLGGLCGDSESVDAAPYVLGTLSPKRLLALDEALRRAWWKPTLPGPHWPVFAPVPDDEIDAQLFCIGCHADGHLRERALRLSQTRDGALPGALAAIRCDDWVAPVRACAEDALRLRIARDPGWLFDQLPLLIALSGRERFRDGAWRTLVEPALRAPEHAARRWAFRGHPHPRASRVVCEAILQADPQRLDDLADWILGQRDPVIVMWALRTLPARDGFMFDDALLARAARHPAASVRAQVLWLHGRRPDPAHAGRVREALRDRSATVRWVAAHAARGLGIDPRTVWRDILDDPTIAERRGALFGLAECAEAQDIPRLRPWLAGVAGDLQAAALRGLVRAGADDAIPLLREALGAPQGKVVGTALALGANVSGFFQPDTLVDGFARAANTVTRRRLLDATRCLDPWQALEALIGMHRIAAGRQGPDASDVACALRGWIATTGQRYAPLHEAKRGVLLARIDASAPQPPDPDWTTIRRIVATY